MSKISIKIKEDIRNVLKSGTEYVFDFEEDKYNKEPYIIITGDNGSGKSTLLNCIRGNMCSNGDDNVSGYGEMNKLGYTDIWKFKNSCEIETDFEKIFFLSSEFDDPHALNNSADAVMFLENGGMASRNKSNGEKMLIMLAQWLEKHKSQFDDRTLLVLDEIDRGYDLRYQKGMMNMLNKLTSDHGVKILIVVHNLLPLLLCENDVFVMGENKKMRGKVYIFMKTGVHIKDVVDLNKPLDKQIKKEKKDGV